MKDWNFINQNGKKRLIHGMTPTDRTAGTTISEEPAYMKSR